MPLYEYRCGDCDGRFDRFRPLDERRDPARCPACGGEGARRFSIPITDNRSVGRDMAPARTPPPFRKPHDHLQEERIRDYQRQDHTHMTFGAGKTTGS